MRATLPSRESACRLVCVGARVCVPIACARGAADHNNGDRDEGYSRGRGGGDGRGVATDAVDAVGRLTSPTVGMDGRRYRVSVHVPDVGSVAGHVGKAGRAHSPAAEHAEEGSRYSSPS